MGERGKQTVTKYLAHWIEDIKGPDGPEPVKPQTLRNYEIELAHILPLVGNLRLAALTAADLEGAFITLTRQGTSLPMRRLIHTRMKSALKHAVDLEYISRNPMTRLKMPTGPVRERQPLTHDQMLRVLRAIRGDTYEALWYLLLRCGVRVSEARALTWDDIDSEKRAIHITKQVVNLPGKILIGPPKSEAGFRDVPLTDDLAAMLQGHKRRIREKPAWRHPELVFPSQTGGYLYLSSIGSRWRTILKREGIPHVPPHSMRHTFMTLAIEQGADMPTLQMVVGHARGNTTMTQRYLHSRDGRDRDLMERLGREYKPDDE